MENPGVNVNTKVLGRVATRLGLPLLMLALIHSACSTAKKSDNADSGNGSGSGGTATGNGRGTGGRGGFGGGMGGGNQTGGFFVYASVANPATGTVTTAPALATQTTPPADPTAGGTATPPAQTGVNESGFRVQCTTDAGSAVQKMALSLKVVNTAGVEYDSDLSFKSNCSDFARITVSDPEVGDVATLSVNLSTLAGVAYASGTTASYTQAAAATTTTTNDSGTGGRREFNQPTSTEVAIALKPVTASSSGTTGTGSGT